MEVTVLKCKLKSDKKNGTYVNLQQRSHGQEFEIRNPGPGVEKNVKKLCDVEVVTMVVPDEIEKSEFIAGENEISEFAIECWNLAVKYEAENIDLKQKIECLEATEATEATEVKKTKRARNKKG